MLGAGHGALGLDFYCAARRARELAVLIALKLFASMASLASGFRGGLFFASLFVGSLLGKLYAIGVDAGVSVLGLDTVACVLVGMGALSTAIVGGPLTMTFLVLESTGNLGIAGGVLAASIATSLAVRATFGYSFTTWRLHLRGETIRGGQDVGWLRDLTVGKMMIPSPPVFLAERERARLPRGLSARQRQRRGRGRRGRALSRASIHVAGGARRRRSPTATTAARSASSSICRRRRCIPTTTSRRRSTSSAPRRPTRSPSPSATTGHVLGTLGEAFAARRYAQETNGAMKGVLGGGLQAGITHEGSNAAIVEIAFASSG